MRTSGSMALKVGLTNLDAEDVCMGSVDAIY
jgi:hypothetical protein